jgi:hypothetical protein
MDEKFILPSEAQGVNPCLPAIKQDRPSWSVLFYYFKNMDEKFILPSEAQGVNPCLVIKIKSPPFTLDTAGLKILTFFSAAGSRCC